MNAWTLPAYLIGSRRAILAVASSRSSLLISVTFVISAGLAREFDGENLVYEPWHILRPLGASFVTGSILFLILSQATSNRRIDEDDATPRLNVTYRSFLSLFWMTAPLAWLYAIPYEQWMDPISAIKLNLWTLLAVALWRVAVIVRVTTVIYGIATWRAFFLVMLFADIVAFGAMMIAPRPVIDMMGGLQYAERDRLLMDISLSVMVLAVLTAPVWFIGAIIAGCRLKPRFPETPTDNAHQSTRPLQIIAIASVLMFIPLLIRFQPQQMRRHHAESLLHEDKVKEAFDFIAQYTQDDFPPSWNPPPRHGYREPGPSLRTVRDTMREHWPPDWFADVYMQKLFIDFRYDLFWSGGGTVFPDDILEEGGFRLLNIRDDDLRVTAQFFIDFKSDLTPDEIRAFQMVIDAPSVENPSNDSANDEHTEEEPINGGDQGEDSSPPEH